MSKIHNPVLGVVSRSDNTSYLAVSDNIARKEDVKKLEKDVLETMLKSDRSYSDKINRVIRSLSDQSDQIKEQDEYMREMDEYICEVMNNYNEAIKNIDDNTNVFIEKYNTHVQIENENNEYLLEKINKLSEKNESQQTMINFLMIGYIGLIVLMITTIIWCCL